MGLVTMKRMVLAVSVSLLMAPAAHAGLLSKWDELKVKTAELESCPGVTMKQQADSFFKDPEWKAIKATDGRKLVNVSGTFTYKERPVRGLLQMWLQGDEFSVEALEINGQPQPQIMIDALLDKMCEAAQEKKASAAQAVPAKQAAPEQQVVTERRGVPKQQVAHGEQALPFVGKRIFNFAGGSGTEEYITIEADGHTVMGSCGASDAMNDFRQTCTTTDIGSFSNPLNTGDALYRIEKDRIYQIEADGSPAKDCMADREDCSVALYE